MRLCHPLDDHYGFSPIEAAATAIDLHNQASKWNKALLDNAARPSGALVYAAREGRLSPEQFERLKAELQEGFQGAKNAGRPLLLEGGLDWKPLSLSPKDMDFIEAKHAAAREIALALGVPPMLLGIPGDNTFSNYAEANRTFWRNTVVPLVSRAADSLSDWLGPAFSQTPLKLAPDLDEVEALAPEREALWSRLEKTTFLTNDEKRAIIGYGPLPAPKFNPGQTRVPAGRPGGGRWGNGPSGSGGSTVADFGTGDDVGGDGTLSDAPQADPSEWPTWDNPDLVNVADKPSSYPLPDSTSPPKKLEDILKPNDRLIGSRGTSSLIRNVSPPEFDQILGELLKGGNQISAPNTYMGRWFSRQDQTIFGIRSSLNFGPTIDIIWPAESGIAENFKVHKR
jgi:hypothetical protein